MERMPSDRAPDSNIERACREFELRCPGFELKQTGTDEDGALTLCLARKPNVNVAYTIGAERAYDEALLDVVEPPKKLGKRDGYDGGWVWRAAAAARAFIGSPQFNVAFGDRDHVPLSAVYELELPATWEASVSVRPSADGVHRLVLDAKIVRKVNDAV